ncbi:unnamed protein product [Cylindrotheca closterium]|uniref:Uncharacterized protein n=1 Tax=Cylindrotheca closterium TaxID=2856 RepID=A0AAD2FMT6_9STRA|nr:unnamed protein product [Cylindrotheca closterium]
MKSDEADIMNVDPIQLVYSIVQAAEEDSDSDSNINTNTNINDKDNGNGNEEEEDPVLDQNQVRVDSEQPQSRLVRAETKEFLQTLHKYLDCRRQMDAKYLEVDELETLAKYNLRIDSGGIELDHHDDQGKNQTTTRSLRMSNPNVRNHGPSLGFKQEYQQQSIHGQAVRTLNELYKAAEVAFPVYQNLIHSLIDKVHTHHQSTNDDDDIQLTFAPLKGKDRAQEKARDDYSQRTPDPGVSWLFDIVRGSLFFASADQMIATLQVLQEDPSIHIVKAKNRFRNPGLSGYRDWNIHIRIQVKSTNDDNDDEVTSNDFHHICEIQMHHQALKVLEKQVHSHQYYEYFRSYFAGATSSLQERLDDLKLIDEGFSLQDGFDDDAFLDALLEGKSKEEATTEEEVVIEEGDNDEERPELSKEESRLVRLGRLFRLHLNEFDLAVRVYGKLLSIQLDKYNGDNRHVQIGYTYDRIASVLIKQGKFDEAMILHHHAYEIKKVALGELDPSLGESSVDLFTQIKGEESYEVAYILGGMGAIYRKQEKMEEALELYKKAVEIDIQQNGEDCTSVAYVYNGMAWIYKYQGNLDEAMRLFQRSHDISKRMYGDQHSSLCFTYNGIADVLKKQNKLEEALKVYEKSLSITERRNGSHHPAVFFVYSKMSKILKKLGRGDEVSHINQTLQKRDSKRNFKNLQRDKSIGECRSNKED